MIIIQENSFEKARNKIKKESPPEGIIFTSENDDLNRKVLEKLDIETLLLNQKNRKDYHKQRNSGLNHVLAKIAKERKIEIGINLDEILEIKNKIEKAKILSRIKQNIKLCSKNDVKMKFISLKKQNQEDKKQLKSLGLVLGMPTWMIKKL